MHGGFLLFYTAMTDRSSMPVGIFDSGVGGLTVASAVRHLLPDETIIYFGDTAHLPYGDKSPGAILHYSKKITDFLIDHKCKVVLAACNTVSSTVWDELYGYSSGRTIALNVLDPVIESLVHGIQVKHIGVIGTKNTINSGAYSRNIKKILPDAEVSCLATPLLAPMIEEGFIYDDISNAIIRAYLSASTLKGIDKLILGCTHYPVIRNQIIKYYDFKVEVVDSAMIAAEYLRSILESRELLSSGSDKNDRFFISDHTEYFGKIAGIFFDKKISLEKIDLWK